MTPVAEEVPTAPPTAFTPWRWWLAGMLLLLSVLNYVDRQALAVLATTIQADLGLSNVEYGRVGQAFLFCYAAAYLAAGRLVDRVGPRLAETGFVAWWSAANVLTGLATGFWSLVAARGLLGLGEPGHYAVAAKVVGRHFPPAERGLAVSMYTMGGTLGAAVAAPLVAFLTLAFGWRAAFVATGVAGFAFAAVWWLVYRDPPTGSAVKVAGPSFRTIVGWKPVWLLVGVRMVTDPAWFFYLGWLAKYLQEVRGFTLADIGQTLWVVFVGADIGCILAGWVAGRLIRRGVPPVVARVRVAGAATLVLACGFTVPLAPNGLTAVILASVFAGAMMAFITSCVALPIDLFPASALGTVQGLIGTGASVGGMVSTGVVAAVVTDHGYDPVFAGLCVLHPAAFAVLWWFLGRRPPQAAKNSTERHLIP